ncbi:hypothetical protein A5634_07145 [Mycobacterium asiaticum]|uniref:Uncharacterized protein n=1 Tax=Mycobacterium asiaticum TaxID=1790 RepID=A0A1A3NNT4_MYCAS|nr:hypothetical protein A5634_07145 [Mycobacterium asiaticum]
MFLFRPGNDDLTGQRGVGVLEVTREPLAGGTELLVRRFWVVGQHGDRVFAGDPDRFGARQTNLVPGHGYPLEVTRHQSQQQRKRGQHSECDDPLPLD